MNAEKVICVFSLSKADIFRDGIEFAIKWLREKGENPYYFREKNLRMDYPQVRLYSFHLRLKSLDKQRLRKIYRKFLWKKDSD